MSILSKNSSLAQVWSQHKEKLALDEGLKEEEILLALNQGRMVLLANPLHPDYQPILVGQPSRVKINANIGTSPMQSNLEEELEKLEMAKEAGADTIMDLSIHGDLFEIRKAMLENFPKPLGTVPLYSVAQKYINAELDPAKIDPEEIFKEMEIQAEQGVDFMTLHCGITKRGAAWASENDERIMGIVSRGGSILARWMRTNNKENPLLTNFDRILDIALKYNITLSLGDGLRPGALEDAGDAAQYEEVIMLSRLAKRALKHGVQAMIEGPGHVPMHEVKTQIQSMKVLCDGAPLYVLGPLVVDSCPGYDHIAGAIGGAIAVSAGVDFLCYLTPAEHLTLPNKKDVYHGIMASRVAARAGEMALGRKATVQGELAMSKARMALDWEKMRELALDPKILCEKRGEHADEEVCAMCGEFCAVKMLRTA